MRKLLSALLLLLCPLYLLTGCSVFDASAYVRGNLDAVYLGQYDPAFLKQVRLEDETVLREAYERGLTEEENFFRSYFFIQDDTEETGKRIDSLYRQLYALSRYEVGKASRSKDGYTVPVSVYPVFLFNSPDFVYAYEAFTASFSEQAESGAFADEAAYNAAWADGVLSLAEERLSSAPYGAPQTVSAQVVRNADGLYAITEDSLSQIDELIIAY